MKKFSLLVLVCILATQTASARTLRPAAAATSSKSSSSAKVDATAAWKTANDYFVGKNVLPAVTGDPVITRAQLAEALVKLTGNVVDKGYGKCFKDVNEESFAPAVCFAAKQKWMEGGKDGKFSPNSPVTFGAALQAIVRSARLPAVAGRGSWFVPFVNAAIKEGVIDKADYAKQIDTQLTRGQLVTMLYRLQLGLRLISIPVGASCTPSGANSVTLKDGSIVVTDGTNTCTVATDPLMKTDAANPNKKLTGLVPSVEASNTADTVPMIEKRAYFLSINGDYWLPYVWELDLKKGTLKQILNTEAPGAVRISPNYTFLSYVGSRGVDMRAMYLKTGLSKSVRLLTTQITFLKSLTMSRKVTMSDYITIDSNETLMYNVYNMRDSSLFQGKISARLDRLFNVRPGK